MAALAGPRKIEIYGQGQPSLFGGQKGLPAKANAVIYHGGLVGKLAAGYWTTATAIANIIRFAIADLAQWSDVVQQGSGPTPWGGNEYVKLDNTGGADGARHFLGLGGIVRMHNKAGDLVTEAGLGEKVYVEDDNTVRATVGTSSACGYLAGMCNDGTTDVWVTIDPLYPVT